MEKAFLTADIMKELMDSSIKITEGMVVHYTFENKTKKVKIPKVSPLTYNINAGRITYVDKESNIFATTAIKGAEDLLIAEGYKKAKDMIVFFSCGSYPVAFKEKWDTIIALAAVY